MATIKFFLLLGLVFFHTPNIFAQDSDYVIDITDRKVYGVVILSTPAVNSTQIKFKDNETQSTQSYRTDQIKAWYKGGQYFETKNYSVNDRKTFSVFMQRMTPEKGKVHLYDYYNTNGDMGYTQTFLERDGEMVEVDYARFNKQLAEFFKDHEELSQKIANKEYKKKDILDIIAAYNEWREYLWRD